MRRLKTWLVSLGLLAVFCLSGFAATYTLSDGRSITGEPIQYLETGVKLRLPNASYTEVFWARLSQEALRELQAHVLRPEQAAFIDPFLENTNRVGKQRIDLKVNEVPHPDRPSGYTGIFAGFLSPLGLLIFAVLYAGNLYAAFEISIFRNQPPPVVVGLAAAFPFVVPAIYLATPTRPQEETVEEAPGHPHPAEEPSVAAEPVAEPSVAEHPHLEPAAPAAPSLPATVTYARGQFTFNRRFFETKLPGFFRVVPAESEKDMLIAMKTARGDYLGRRISRITQTELHLQEEKGGASADIMIPFNDIFEVQVRHKDAAS